MCVLTQPDLPTAVSGPGEAMCAEKQHQNKTNGSEGTCLWIQGSAQPHRAQEGLLSRWGKSHIPLKWASLGWKPCVSSPDDPRPRLYLCKGEPWSWVLCLPARILGSRVGVARQAHHFTLGCFAFGVKRDPQMSRHCHSSNLSPQEFQRWAKGGSSWSAVLSHVRVCNTQIFQQILRSVVFCFKTQFEILILTENHMYLSSNHSHVILTYWTSSMMSTFYLPVAEKSLACLSKLETSSRKSTLREEARREAVTRNLFSPLISASDCVLTSSHPTASDNSLQEWQEERCRFTGHSFIPEPDGDTFDK